MLLRHALGALLKQARLARGLTLRELSDAAAVSVAYLSELERGRKEASSEILAAICPVLELPLSSLIHGAATDLASAETGSGVLVELRSVTEPHAVVDLGSARGPVTDAGAVGPVVRAAA